MQRNHSHKLIISLLILIIIALIGFIGYKFGISRSSNTHTVTKEVIHNKPKRKHKSSSSKASKNDSKHSHNDTSDKSNNHSAGNESSSSNESSSNNGGGHYKDSTKDSDGTELHSINDDPNGYNAEKKYINNQINNGVSTSKAITSGLQKYHVGF